MERMQGRGEGQPRDTMKTASILGNRASIPQGNTVRIIPAEGEGAGVLHSPEALADGSCGGWVPGISSLPHTDQRATSARVGGGGGNRPQAQSSSLKVPRDRGGLWGSIGHLCPAQCRP